MASVEQAFHLEDNDVRKIGDTRVVRFRDEVLGVVDLAERLGLDSQQEPRSAVVVWGAGTRFALTVDALINQISAEPVEMPRLAHGEFTDGALYHEERVVPILRLGALSGMFATADDNHSEFTEMQQSALAEIANIGSGHAATALSALIGRPVDVGYATATLTVLARAIDELGEPMNRSALVDTPIAGDQGSMLLVFPADAAEQLCEMLGTSITDEIGVTALQEVGNILSASYLNALVEMTGIALEVEPPRVEIDLLGRMISQSRAGGGSPTDPTVMMRSYLTVEGSTTRFSFLFVPRIKSVELLLERLGVGA
jgi:chemotaxis protein CheC